MVKDLGSLFNEIQFEPIEHRYHVKDREMTPVSTMVGKFYEHFETDEQAFLYAMRHGGDPVEIAEGWRETGRVACDFGTSVHNFGEGYFYNPTLTPSNGHEEAVVRFWNTLPSHIIKLYSELQVYSKRLGFAGTIDNIFYDIQKKGIILSDYKTNKDMFKNFMGKKMLPPFDHMYDMPLSKYELQLSLYQIPLLELGLKVIDRWIIWLKPDGMYERFHGNDYSKEIEMELLKNVA